MGRPEKVIDPAAGPLSAFAHDLRSLRTKAGIRYRDMAVATHYSASTLAQAADSKRLPSLAVTLAYVKACGGDAIAWEARWREVSCAEVSAAPDAAVPPDPAPAGTRPRRRPWPVPVAPAGLLVVAVAVATATGSAPADPAPAPTTFVAVTGTGCSKDLDRGTYANNYRTGWLRAPGGWTGDDCDGWFVYAPLSGSETAARNLFTWWFKPGLDGDAACLVEVYVPASGYADARAAIYHVRSTADGDDAGHFTIDQVANRGTWVSRGPYAVSGHLMSVRLSDRGADTGTVAAGPLKVACTRRQVPRAARRPGG
jgi:hypothetical protein